MNWCRETAQPGEHVAGTEPSPRQFSNGMLSIYMTVDFFDTDGFFGEEMRTYLEFVQGARPAEAGGEVLLPGLLGTAGPPAT